MSIFSFEKLSSCITSRYKHWLITVLSNSNKTKSNFCLSLLADGCCLLVFDGYCHLEMNQDLKLLWLFIPLCFLFFFRLERKSQTNKLVDIEGRIGGEFYLFTTWYLRRCRQALRFIYRFIDFVSREIQFLFPRGNSGKNFPSGAK